MDTAEIVRRALEEDRVEEDVTTRLLTRAIPDQAIPGGNTVFVIRAKQAGIFSGSEWALEVCRQCGLNLGSALTDGQPFEVGTRIAEGEGHWAAILKAERTLLNGLQHLSGIATRTHRFVEVVRQTAKERNLKRVPGVYHIRKTLPLLRDLARHAVQNGGGQLHRRDLSEFVLFKENHKEILRYTGRDWKDLVAAMSAEEKKTALIEVESLAEAQELAELGLRFVMLDNFTPAQVAEALQALPPDMILEVSGGLNLETIANYVQEGVARLSIGGLTQSSPAVDLSLDWALPKSATPTALKDHEG